MEWVISTSQTNKRSNETPLSSSIFFVVEPSFKRNVTVDRSFRDVTAFISISFELSIEEQRGKVIGWSMAIIARKRLTNPDPNKGLVREVSQLIDTVIIVSLQLSLVLIDSQSDQRGRHELIHLGVTDFTFLIRIRRDFQVEKSECGSTSLLTSLDSFADESAEALSVLKEVNIEKSI